MAVREEGTRQDTFVVRLTIDGDDWGVWDKKDGGEIDSDSTIYHPGAMAEQQDLGGVVTTGNITVSRIYDRVDDHSKIQKLLSRAGKGVVSVSQKPMDKDGNEFASDKSVTWVGRLKRVTLPSVDSESSSAAMVELEIVPKGKPTLQ